MDWENEMESIGRDCSTIDYADIVRCSKGRCVVKKCQDAYRVSRTRDSCISLLDSEL